MRKLERENTRLEKELDKARLIIDVQGKVAGLLGLSLEDGDELVKAAEALKFLHEGSCLGRFPRLAPKTIQSAKRSHTKKRHDRRRRAANNAPLSHEDAPPYPRYRIKPEDA